MGPKKADGAAATAPKAKSTHASYQDMITEAILALKDRMGSSRQSLKKYVKANNTITASDNMFDSLFNKALKAGVDKGVFEQPKGPSGTTKLSKKTKDAAAKPAPKKEGDKEVKKAAPKKEKDGAKKATTKKPAAAKKEKEAGEKKPAAKKAAAPKKAAPKKAAAAKKEAPAAADKPAALAKTKSGRVAKTTAKPAAKKAAAPKKAAPKKEKAPKKEAKAEASA
ncbi:linker histone H1 and H5 family-domain-containing protein [Xylaria sp. FL1042]|nr:linker histone H1 and H5 family-domain-containing protein [Xylaria sp. FL1042]